METKHWGELPPRPEELPPPLDAAGRAQLLKPKPMKITPLAANPFQGGSGSSGSSTSAGSSSKQATLDVHHIPVYNPDILYFLKLQRLWSKMTSPSTPSGAEYTLPKKCSNKASALGTKCLDLPRDELIRQTRQAVVLTAHQLGYDDAKESALDLMTDVTGQYLQKLTQVLRQVTDTADLRPQEDSQDFVDSLDRAFHECRVPSLLELHRFWLMERRSEAKLLERITSRINQTKNSPLTSSQAGSQLTELEFFDKSPPDTLMEDFPEFVVDPTRF